MIDVDAELHAAGHHRGGISWALQEAVAQHALAMLSAPPSKRYHRVDRGTAPRADIPRTSKIAYPRNCWTRRSVSSASAMSLYAGGAVQEAVPHARAACTTCICRPRRSLRRGPMRSRRWTTCCARPTTQVRRTRGLITRETKEHHGARICADYNAAFLFVTTACCGIHDEDALAAALAAKYIARAVWDVWEDEPLLYDHEPTVFDRCAGQCSRTAGGDSS